MKILKTVVLTGLLLNSIVAASEDLALNDNETKGYDWAKFHQVTKPYKCNDKLTAEERNGCMTYITETVPSMKGRLVSRGGNMSSNGMGR